MCPKAIRDRYFAEEIGDETVVYDAVSHQSHCLNATAAFVWRLCDGQTSTTEMASRLQEEFGAEGADELVSVALSELRSAGMLDQKSVESGWDGFVTRRQLLGKAAVIGAMVPLVASAANNKPPQKHRSFVPKRAAKGGSDF